MIKTGATAGAGIPTGAVTVFLTGAAVTGFLIGVGGMGGIE